jgi:hypothetical protein
MLELAACQKASRAPATSVLIDEGEKHKSFLESQNVRVEYYGCEGGLRSQTMMNLSSMNPYPRELALIDAGILLSMLSQCEKGRPAGPVVDENGNTLLECRNVYFATYDPGVYHFVNVCPDTELAYRPTENFCGPVKFLGEDASTERCLIVFAD